MPRLVFWRIDDAFMLLIPFSLGVLLGSLLLIGGSFLNVIFFRRFRKRNKHINYRALAYWIFGVGSKVPSHIRRVRR